jgi:hypothetical protein
LDIGGRGRIDGQDATGEQITEAKGAVRAIGTNALPFLLTWIRFEAVYPKRFYRGILDLLPLPEHTRAVLWAVPGTKNERLASLAVYGFGILGTNALPAFEDLSRLANDPRHPLPQILAAKALPTVTNTPAL